MKDDSSKGISGYGLCYTLWVYGNHGMIESLFVKDVVRMQ